MVENRAGERLGGRTLVFELMQGQASRWDADLFEAFAETAAAFGATHIKVGDLPYQHGNWVLPDNDDPYAAWCNCSPSMLRVCPPEDIQQWVTLDEARRCQDFIAQQMDIIRPLGLRVVTGGIEPLWLPEGVYRAHPRWRGTQCELGRIAGRPYFAPSIDEPEVLDLYREAMKQYVTLFPEIDDFQFMSNDSGGGIAWTPNVYPGLNGPIAHRTRDGGARVAGFLNALRDGAVEAGRDDVRVNLFSSGLMPELVASTREKLEPNLFINWSSKAGERWAGPGASLSAGLWSLAYPVVGVGDVPGFAAAVQKVYDNPEGDSLRCTISFGIDDLDTARTVLEACVAQPGRGAVSRTTLQLDVASRIAGSPEAGEQLLGVYDTLRTALHGIAQIRQKGFGHVLPFCGVSMRWLLRPLVAQPEALTRDETAHYRDFVFAVGDQKDDPNAGLVLGKAVFNGESVTWMARWCLHAAASSLDGARATLDRLAKQARGDAAGRLSLLDARVGALACLARNAKHTIMFKYAVDTRDHEQFGPNMMDYDDNMVCDMRALNQRKIAREELDNTARLVELIESQPGVVLHAARNAAEESVFTLGPDVAAALRRKMDIMLDHWQDFERLYPTTKVWDFEPSSPTKAQSMNDE